MKWDIPGSTQMVRCLVEELGGIWVGPGTEYSLRCGFPWSIQIGRTISTQMNGVVRRLLLPPFVATSPIPGACGTAREELGKQRHWRSSSGMGWAGELSGSGK